VEFIKRFNSLFEKSNINEVPNKCKIIINGLIPIIQPFITIFNFLTINYKILSPNYYHSYHYKYPEGDGDKEFKGYGVDYCLVIGYKTSPIVMHLMTLIGLELYKNYNFKVFISYAKYDFDDYGNTTDNNSDSCYFTTNIFSGGRYTNISEAIEPKEFLDISISAINEKFIIKKFPNSFPDSCDYIYYVPEEYDEYDSKQSNYESDRDVFDALTDGQYGDYDEYYGLLDRPTDY